MNINYRIEKVADVKFPILTKGKYKMFLFSPESFYIEPNSTAFINLGLKCKVPQDALLIISPVLHCNIDEDGFEWDDSVMIDSSYEGEWKLIVHNLSSERVNVCQGDVLAEAYMCRKMNNIRWTYYDEGNFVEIFGGD